METKIKKSKIGKKIVCIYHSIDLDGWMSAAIVNHWFNKQEVPNKQGEDCNTIAFIGYNYGEPIPDLSEYDKVIMCDISFPKEEMINLYENKDLIWLDHHISAINESKHSTLILSYDDANGIRDTKFAACELTWKYFFPNETMPEIVRLLGRYDCFGHKGTNEEQKVLEFQYGARSIISNPEDAYQALQQSLHSRYYEELNLPSIEMELWDKGEAIYNYLCTEAKQVYENGFKIELGQSSVKLVDLATIPDTEPETLKNAVGTFLPYKFICINKERFNPINFGIDYHKDGYDGCACFWYNGKQWNFSLYNANGFVDCSVIAKRYGGGGHKGAAGFVIDNINQVIK